MSSRGLISRISSLYIHETDRFILPRTIGHSADFSKYKELTVQNWVPFKSLSNIFSDDVKEFQAAMK